MRKRTLFLSTVLLFISLLSAGCSTNPPNKPICAEINLTKGVCTDMLTGKTYVVDEDHKLNGKTWWESRPYMLRMPIDTWAALKVYIIKVCKKYGCSDPEIANWDRAVESIDGLATRPASIIKP
jgi:hypothetical protein